MEIQVEPRARALTMGPSQLVMILMEEIVEEASVNDKEIPEQLAAARHKRDQAWQRLGPFFYGKSRSNTGHKMRSFE